MPELELVFLAVCNDYPVLKTVTSAIQRLGGHLHCVPSISTASDYIERRKMDGIVIDTALDGALNLVQFIRDGRNLRCLIQDDGKGFDIVTRLARKGQKGLGLIGMHERLNALGGTLQVNSEPAGGTSLFVTIPLEI